VVVRYLLLGSAPLLNLKMVHKPGLLDLRRANILRPRMSPPQTLQQLIRNRRLVRHPEPDPLPLLPHVLRRVRDDLGVEAAKSVGLDTPLHAFGAIVPPAENGDDPFRSVAVAGMPQPSRTLDALGGAVPLARRLGVGIEGRVLRLGEPHQEIGEGGVLFQIPRGGLGGRGGLAEERQGVGGGGGDAAIFVGQFARVPAPFLDHDAFDGVVDFFRDDVFEPVECVGRPVLVSIFAFGAFGRMFDVVVVVAAVVGTGL